ncbi:MAG: hypothetical protein HY084_11955 [Gemmatimonadetes bacterium]|nr:hypothetical protein [Gemmatimonadota bacterium]
MKNDRNSVRKTSQTVGRFANALGRALAKLPVVALVCIDFSARTAQRLITACERCGALAHATVRSAIRRLGRPAPAGSNPWELRCLHAVPKAVVVFSLAELAGVVHLGARNPSAFAFAAATLCLVLFALLTLIVVTARTSAGAYAGWPRWPIGWFVAGELVLACAAILRVQHAMI